MIRPKTDNLIIKSDGELAKNLLSQDKIHRKTTTCSKKNTPQSDSELPMTESHRLPLNSSPD